MHLAGLRGCRKVLPTLTRNPLEYRAADPAFGPDPEHRPAPPAVPVALRRVRAPARRLDAKAFPEATPLNAFFAWNEARRNADRRYRILCRLQRLMDGFDPDFCLAYLAGELSAGSAGAGRASGAPFSANVTRRPITAAARQVIDAPQAAVGASDAAPHAAVRRPSPRPRDDTVSAAICTTFSHSF
jgi:hypothetical protein